MNATMLSTVAQLCNDELLSRVKHLASREREVTAILIAHLSELDVRGLYLAEGCASLFTYCERDFGRRRPLVAREARASFAGTMRQRRPTAYRDKRSNSVRTEFEPV